MNEDLETTPITFLHPSFRHRPIDDRTMIAEVCWMVRALLDDIGRMAEEDDRGRGDHLQRTWRTLPPRAIFLLHTFLRDPWHCWAVLTSPMVGMVDREPLRQAPVLGTVLDALRFRTWAGIAAAFQDAGIGARRFPHPHRRESADLWPGVDEAKTALRELLRGLSPAIEEARQRPCEIEHPIWQELSSTVKEHLQSLPNILGVHASLPIELVDYTYGSPLLGRPSSQGSGPSPFTDFSRCTLGQTMRDAAIVAVEDLLMDEEQFTRFLEGEDHWRP